jgi:hypothetical protein
MLLRSKYLYDDACHRYELAIGFGDLAKREWPLNWPGKNGDIFIYIHEIRAQALLYYL